ncbi:MAG: hypothetical protein NTW25_02230 [Candidatus Kapabacteria bacterium]|nr:hypothetical protein [Candidatus Kapabacteria bacterium]
MITKNEIESAIVSVLSQLDDVVAKREIEEDILTAPINTVFVKVRSYQFPNDLTLENLFISKNQLAIINIQIRIVYRSIKEKNNISEFEDKVINELVGLKLDIENYKGSDLILMPFQLNETMPLSQELKQSVNIFRIMTNLDFN